MRQWTIRDRTITDESPPYLVAEIGHNHNGSRVLAGEMIRVAADCGAHAVKLQRRSAAFYAKLRAKGLVAYADLRQDRELYAPDYGVLREQAHHSSLAFIATAFDLESLAFLVDLVGVDAIKLASGAVHNPGLLAAAAATGLPLILSTGCADLTDVETAMLALQCRGNVALLQCTSAYPCAASDLHLQTITTYRTRYPETIVGLSSHHPDTWLEPVAVGLGARIIEKHFTLSKRLGPGDHAHSLEPDELAQLAARLRDTHAALGNGSKRFLPVEHEGRRRLDVGFNTPTTEPMGA